MAYIDLGSPFGIVVSGEGASTLAGDIGGEHVEASVKDYSEWLLGQRIMVAPECGARVMEHVVEAPVGRDDAGLLVAAERF